MNYAYDIDRHSPEEQLPLAQFVSIILSNENGLIGIKKTNNNPLLPFS